MSNFFRSLFGAKKAAKIVQVAKSKMQTRRLELIGLEERITPATFSTDAAGLITIQLAAGESLTAISASVTSSSATTDVVVINATTSGTNSLLGTSTSGLVLTGVATGASTVTYTAQANTASTGQGLFTGITILGVAGSSVSETVAISGAVNLLTGNGAAAAKFNVGTSVESLTVAGAITAKAGNSTTGAVTLAATAVSITAAGTINTTVGDVGISGVISTAGNVTTTTGLTTYTGAVTLTGAIANASTTGGVTFSSTVNGAFGITTTASGAATVTFTGIVGGTAPVGAISVTTVGGSGATGTFNSAAITATSLTMAGVGNVNVGALTTTGAISVTNSGTIVLTGAVSAASVVTVGASAVSLGGSVKTTGATTFGGNVTGTSVNVIAGTTATITGALTSSGAISVVGAGLVTLTGAVGASSLNTGVTVTSTGDNVVISSSVLSGSSAATGNIAISAATAGKTISLAGPVVAGLNSNILLTGDVLSNNATLSANGGTGIGTIAITGKVDAATSGDALAIVGAASVTLSGAVGSSGTLVMGNLTITGAGTFLASSSVTGANISVTGSATSATFVGAVKTTGTTGFTATTTGAGTLTFSSSITNVDATNAADVSLKTVTGALSVVGAIVGTNDVTINSTSGNITLGGAMSSTGVDSDILIGADSVTVTGTSPNFTYTFNGLTLGNILVSGAVSTTGNGSAIAIVTGATGNITTSSTLTTSGGLFVAGNTATIIIDTDGTGDVNVNGAISTTGGGNISIGADSTGVAIGGDTVNINATLTTSGITAGNIQIGVNGGTATVNKAVTAGAGGNIAFTTNAATDAITIVSGANITAGDSVGDFGPGHLNLGANITAGTALVATAKGIILDAATVNLTGAVSLKTQGTGGNADITLVNVNGAQNLTLETNGVTGSIITLTSVGQTTALKTVTVTNSAGVNAGPFSAANVVLTDTTGTIAFGGSTVITSGLTTAAKAYSVSFAGTTVLSGAPVFLNTGNVTFGSSVTDITSLTTGATITGTAATTVDLAGTIVSGGAFNIGALPLTTTIADGTGLILNSTSAASTFAGKVVLLVGDELDLLGVGTLTLSGDSSATGVDGDIVVINGTLNVTGKIGAGSVSTATSGTISGAGGTIGTLSVNTGTVAPGGTLKTGAVNFNAATTYKAAVLTTTTASNLETAALINLGGAVLSLSSVAAGLKVGNAFTIIDNTAVSGNLITTTFAGLPEGSSVSAKDTAGNTVAFQISYIGGTNANDVTLKVTSITSTTPAPTAPAQPMVAGQPALNKFTAIGADAGGAPQVTITFQNGTYVSFLAYASTFTGGVRVALGDVDGNGSTDLITGAGPGGGPQVNVYNVNNATGAVSLQKSLFAFSAPSFTGGVYVAAGDTNADGFDDVIIGAGKTGGSRVQVYAGSATGLVTTSTLNDFFSYSPAFTGGVVVAAGDRNADGDDEVITAPASSGGYNIKSFDVNGKGNSPTLVDNFFAFNNTTSVGGLSLAVGLLNSGGIADLIVGTSNGGYGVIVDSATAGIAGVPFAGFTGAIRAGVAEDSTGKDYAVALAGPTGGPRISVFSVGATSLSETDNLFVMNTSFKGGLFGTPTLPANIIVT